MTDKERIAEALVKAYKDRKVWKAVDETGKKLQAGSVIRCIRGKEWELIYADKHSVSVLPAGSKDPFDSCDYHPSVFNLTIEESLW
jgi:hypothetical protein